MWWLDNCSYLSLLCVQTGSFVLCPLSCVCSKPLRYHVFNKLVSSFCFYRMFSSGEWIICSNATCNQPCLPTAFIIPLISFNSFFSLGMVHKITQSTETLVLLLLQVASVNSFCSLAVFLAVPFDLLLLRNCTTGTSFIFPNLSIWNFLAMLKWNCFNGGGEVRNVRESIFI